MTDAEPVDMRSAFFSTSELVWDESMQRYKGRPQILTGPWTADYWQRHALQNSIEGALHYIQEKYGIKGVDQTIFTGNKDDIPGNCLQAAVATLFGLPLEEVPHFLQTEDWWLSLDRFAARRGYVMMPFHGKAPGFGLAFGPSPRGTHHAVVYKAGVPVWDPHPDRSFLLSVSTYIEFVGRPE